MADRATMKSELGSWLTAITASTIGAGDGLPVYWRGTPAGRRGPSYILAYLPTPQMVGRDVTAYEHDALGAAGEEIRHYQIGQRVVTLSLQVWSHRASGDDDAGEYVRRIRDRIRLDDWRTMMDGAGVRFSSFSLDRDLTEILDDRDWTIYQLDVRLNAASLEEGAPTTFIEIVEAEVELNEPPPIWEGEIEVS